MKVISATLFALIAAVASTAACAQQLKTPRKPAAAAQPAAAPEAAPEKSQEVKDKEAAGQLAAAGWLVLLDRKDWGRAWETSSSVFRSTVPLPAWMDGIPKARDLGDFVERTPQEANYSKTLASRPDGDYVTVIFNSKFAKRPEVQEVVTTVRDTDGKWRVTGYSTR